MTMRRTYKTTIGNGFKDWFCGKRTTKQNRVYWGKLWAKFRRIAKAYKMHVEATYTAHHKKWRRS